MKLPLKWMRLCWMYGLLLGFSVKSIAQPVQEYNRFQYHKYEWRVLSAETFRLYFPKHYDSLAAFVSVHLPTIMEEVSKAMGSVSFRGIPNLIIYPAVDQLYESNVGLYESGIQRFPTIHLKGKRILLAFNGSYASFRKQIRLAYAGMVWENLFRNTLEEQALGERQDIPAWFKAGSIRYFGEAWPLKREQQLAALIRKKRPESWQRLLQEDPALAGQAFCYLLDLRYRQDACKQTLFQLKSGKSLATALRLVTKRSLTRLSEVCIDFYTQRFQGMDPAPSDTLWHQLTLAYPGEDLRRPLSGPDGKQLVYVSEKAGIRTIYLQRLPIDQKQRTRLTRYVLPPWIGKDVPDRYPVPVWTNSGRGLWIARPYKGHIRTSRFSDKGHPGASRILYGVDGMMDFIIAERDAWLFSAFRRGQSDIVAYHPGRLRFTPLTDDFADHTDLSYKRYGALKRIAYRSGFPADNLYYPDSIPKTYGIYSKDLPSELKNAVKLNDRLLLPDSGGIHWSKPILLPGEELSVSGSGKRDTFVLTNTGYARPQNVTQGAPFSAWMREYRERQQVKDSLDRLLQQLKAKDESPLRAIFQSAGDGPKKIPEDSSTVRRYRPAAIKPYSLQLYSSYFSLQVNNDYFINRYQPFQAYLGSFKFPEPGMLAQGGVSDLFENHHLSLGYRMPATTEGSDFFFQYKNTARNLDWQVRFFRKVESLSPDGSRDWKDANGRRYPAAAKVKTHYYELGFHYPLKYDLSLDYLIAARDDRTIFLATDRYSLNFEDLRQWWNIHSLSLSRNRLRKQEGEPFLYRGWQAKLLADGMLALKRPSTILGGVQMQIEYHQPIGKILNLVARGQAGISGGQSHILYNFGGVDNNMILHTDTSIRFSQQASYAFLSLITPFRGYPQSGLYGSAFGLLNLDLYLPLFSSLIPVHTGFNVLNQLQLGVFSDLAATRTPEGVSRSLVSWGFSARTLLAGYPIRVEVAWPGDFGKKPVWYLSLRF